ncbi:MAG: hypothetical protein IK032_04775, partial [Bacteroidales bacterium]|nr:hypothetical protein [Bacteroidales bacterium]
MDPKKMLLIKGEPKTLTVKQCHYERSVGKYVVKYKNSDREYQYAYKSVEWLSASRVLSGNYIVKHNGFTHRDVISITSFSNGFNNYYRIF